MCVNLNFMRIWHRMAMYQCHWDLNNMEATKCHSKVLLISEKKPGTNIWPGGSKTPMCSFWPSKCKNISSWVNHPSSLQGNASIAFPQVENVSSCIPIVMSPPDPSLRLTAVIPLQDAQLQSRLFFDLFLLSDQFWDTFQFLPWYNWRIDGRCSIFM